MPRLPNTVEIEDRRNGARVPQHHRPLRLEFILASVVCGRQVLMQPKHDERPYRGARNLNDYTGGSDKE